MIADIVETGLGVAFGIGVGPLIFRMVFGRSAARVAPKHPCPWTPCGYPLPETPLCSKLEDDRNWPTVVQETCDGCGKWVCWEPFNKRYVRYATKAADPK